MSQRRRKDERIDESRQKRHAGCEFATKVGMQIAAFERPADSD
jgi:hypothetical protein